MKTVFVLLAAGVAATSVSADVIAINGSVNDSTERTGSNFSATLDYAYQGGNEGRLNIRMTNTTPMDVGGFLTGFLFNVDSGDPFAVIALVTGAQNFNDGAGDSGNPFGSSYDGGARVGNGWEGGGNPSQGLAIGATGDFGFRVTASDASALTASSFINGPYRFDFVVRFRGLNDGGSDKVPVPAPGAAALLALGAFAARRRR